MNGTQRWTLSYLRSATNGARVVCEIFSRWSRRGPLHVKFNRKLIHIVYPVVSLKIVLAGVIHIAEDDFYEWKQAWFFTPDLDILQMPLDIHVNNAQVLLIWWEHIPSITPWFTLTDFKPFLQIYCNKHFV